MFAIPAVTEYKLNVRSLAISVYRAIRMGWTPEVVYGQDWPKSHYDPLVNKPAVKLKSTSDFNTLAHRYSKVTGSVYRLAREEQTTEQWFAMYRKLTNQKELNMNAIHMTIITSIGDAEELLFIVNEAADDIMNELKTGKHEAPIITSRRRTDDGDVHFYHVSLNIDCEERVLEDFAAGVRNEIFDVLGNGFVLQDYQGFAIKND